MKWKYVPTFLIFLTCWIISVGSLVSAGYVRFLRAATTQDDYAACWVLVGIAGFFGFLACAIADNAEERGELENQ